MPNVYLNVDISDVANKLSDIEKKLKPEEFDKLIRRSFNETGRHVRVIVGKDVPKQYHATSGWVKKCVGAPIISGGGGSITCIIPMTGNKGSIGGTFGASGPGKRGGRARKGSRISAAIVRGQKSILPTRMTHQGGQPPFFMHGIVMTRKTRARYPIASVSGLAAPQMPVNRSAEDVEADIVEFLDARVTHYAEIMI